MRTNHRRTCVVAGAAGAIVLLAAGPVAASTPSVVVPADGNVRVTGRGCAPNTTVQFVVTRPHATGTDVGTATSDGNGSFDGVVNVGSMAAGDADLVGDCLGPSGSTINAFHVHLRTSLASTGAPEIVEAFAAVALVAVGSGLVCLGRRAN